MIKNGTSAIFFPEGTSSKTSQLLPLKKGAFRFAYDLGLPMLPVTINGTDKVFPADSWNLFRGKVDIVVHQAIYIRQYGESKIHQLIEDTKTAIASARC